MPRKRPLPQRERAICRRLKAFRLDLRITQATFARDAEVAISTLAAYEHERAPVRFGIAMRISESFDLDLRWLATGKGLPVAHPLVVIPDDLDEKLLLGEVWSKSLMRCYREVEEERDQRRGKGDWHDHLADLLGVSRKVEDLSVAELTKLTRSVQRVLNELRRRQAQKHRVEAIVRKGEPASTKQKFG